jgi:hypothetical protein
MPIEEGRYAEQEKRRKRVDQSRNERAGDAFILGGQDSAESTEAVVPFRTARMGRV